MSDTIPVAATKILAIDTSTERLGVALGHAGLATEWHHEAPGGAQASLSLLGVVQTLLAQAGWRLSELDAIAVGVGPGAFTGLRTACAVAQGLALAARPGGLPVLPVPTLLAVAEDARFHWMREHPDQLGPDRIVATLDARMDEVYVAEVQVHTPPETPLPQLRLAGGAWVAPPEQALDKLRAPDAGTLLAGHALTTYEGRWPAAWSTCHSQTAWPSPLAMLRLVPALWAAGAAGPAEAAQPVYVRDKVAQTTAERERLRATAT